MEMNYASKGVAGAGLGTGIAGLALGVLNSGWLNGFGGNAAGLAIPAAEYMAAADKARIAELEAEKYADKNGIEVYRQIKAEMNDLRDRITGRIDYLAAEMSEQKVTNQKTADGILMARQEFKADLDMEKQKRRCADDKIVQYVNTHFEPRAVPNVVTNTTGTNGTDAVTLTSTTPGYLPLYNPLDD